MAIPVKISTPNEDGDSLFAPPEDGYHAAVLADIIPLGVRPGPYGSKDQIVLLWLVDEKNKNGDPKEVLQFVSNTLFKNNTTGKESTLRSVVTALRGGKDLTEAEAKAPTYDIERHLGTDAKLLTEQYVTKNGQGKLRSKVLRVKVADPNKGVHIPASFVRDKDKPAADRLATKFGGGTPTEKTLGGRAAAAAVLSPATKNIHGLDITDEDVPL